MIPSTNPRVVPAVNVVTPPAVAVGAVDEIVKAAMTEQPKATAPVPDPKGARKLHATVAVAYLTEFIAKMKREYNGKAGHNPWPKIYAAEAVLRKLAGANEVEESALERIRADFPADHVPVVVVEQRAGNIDYTHLSR